MDYTYLDYINKVKIFETKTKEETEEMLEKYVETKQSVQINSKYCNGIQHFISETILTGRLIGVIHEKKSPPIVIQGFRYKPDQLQKLQKVYLFLPDTKIYKISQIVMHDRNGGFIMKSLPEMYDFEVSRTGFGTYDVKVLKWLEIEEEHANKIVPLDDSRINYVKLKEGLNDQHIDPRDPKLNTLFNPNNITEISSFMEPAYSFYTDKSTDPEIPYDLLNPKTKTETNIQPSLPHVTPIREARPKCSGRNCIISGGRKKTNRRKKTSRRKKRTIKRKKNKITR